MPTMTYPQARLSRTNPGRWQSPAGYVVTRHPHTPYVVYTPTGHRRAEVDTLRSVKQTVAALEATGGEYGLPWYAYAPTTVAA